ncbi:MAG: hypothetical protein MUE53_03070 [Chitinophagales bacterium]|nr:hypothetical protein [Chitinophagales bacterium]
MKQLILILGMMTAANISAQLNLYENGFKPLYWGISLGINSYNYNVNRMPFSTMNDSIRFSYGSPGPGYNVGAI